MRGGVRPSGAAGAALTDDIPAAHRVTLVTIGLASSAVRYSCCGCPNSPRRQPRRPGGRGAADWSDTSRMLPDARYLTLTGLNFLLFSFDTRLLVVVLQIPVSELATGRRRTTRMLTWTGAMPAVSSLCFAASGSLAGGPARAWLTAALVTLSLAELTANSAVWGLSIALAPEERRGCCLAVFDLSVAGQGVLGGARPLPVSSQGAAGQRKCPHVFAPHVSR
ncbi:hypothetical protein ACFZDI_31600 [Streptomyces sp. NPDC007907]|uniref:hypothetical protein n=1 Tax=Streptomyces sp. NPDC007907 TaxID=3364789 RepID=UPI0036E7AB78